jgi:hypothetical protein
MCSLRWFLRPVQSCLRNLPSRNYSFAKLIELRWSLPFGQRWLRCSCAAGGDQWGFGLGMDPDTNSDIIFSRSFLILAKLGIIFCIKNLYSGIVLVKIHKK